jgi:hypothetical protein
MNFQPCLRLKLARYFMKYELKQDGKAIYENEPSTVFAFKIRSLFYEIRIEIVNRC